MAVYLFTFHTYRSWNADRPQGYVRKGEGILPPDPKQAEQYDRAAKHPPVFFDHLAQRTLIDETRKVCDEKSWRLHQVATDRTHIHILISWTGFIEWAEVSRTLKRRLGSMLSKVFDRPGPWFSRGGSRKQVSERKHYDYLMSTYLPRHHGALWRKGG